MNKYLSSGIFLISLLSGSAYGANDSEYLQFIENNGAMVLETYRLPEGSDLSYWGTDRDSYFYKKIDSDSDQKAPYWTKGYFNADSQPDYLYIMFHRTHNKAYLIGFMSSEDRYKSIAIEPSSGNMAVETKQNMARHYQLEGHGHGLIWNEGEAKFNVLQ